jgi:molybdopterin/thiamine biosynthesis adenylyltransferase
MSPEMLVKLKPAVWERDGDELHLMADQREMQTLSDPDGRVEELLRLLSADVHTLETLTAGLAQSFPDVSPGDVAEGVSGLDGLGMVEDVAKADLLSQRQQSRYFTNLVFFQSFATLAHAKEEMQQRLMGAHVLILGVGGLGSMVLMHLAGAGVGRFTLLEHDVVEERNFSRQFIYRHADIGRLKVERAGEWVREYSPGTEVLALNRTITSPDDVAELLAGTGTGLVIAAVDTPPLEIGSWVNQACVAAGVPHIRGMMGVQSGYFSVGPGSGPCSECGRLVMLGERDEPGAAGAKWRLIERLSLVNRGVGPVAGQIGALVAMEALRYLTGFAEPVAAGVLHSFDLSEGGAETLTPWEKRADCPVCAPAGTSASKEPGWPRRPEMVP